MIENVDYELIPGNNDHWNIRICSRKAGDHLVFHVLEGSQLLGVSQLIGVYVH